MRAGSVFILLLILAARSMAQIPTFDTPQPASLGVLSNQNWMNPASAVTGSSPFAPSVEEYHRLIMQEVEQHQRQQTVYKQRQQEIAEAEKEFGRPVTSDKLPSKSHLPGAEFYRNAFSELVEMAEGRKPVELKKAVFAVENAFFDNRLSYDTYLAFLSQALEICHTQLRNKQNPGNVDKLMAVFSYFADTISTRVSGYEGTLVHYPVSYDFEDFYGREDQTKMFVTKLMRSNTGQCHSMPLLFLILSQEMGAEAYMAYAPEHSYVKFRDERGNWHNIELTNNIFTTDAFVLESGFVKAEAIRNRIYLDTVSTKRLLAENLVDLAQSYSRKYGMDEFVEMCADKALEVNPDYISALLVKSDYQTTLTNHVLASRQIRTQEQMEQDSIAFAQVQKTLGIYHDIDSRGYEEMPEEVYARWLKSVEQEKNRRSHENQLQIISTQIKSR